MFGCKKSQRLNQADGPLQLAAADVIRHCDARDASILSFEQLQDIELVPHPDHRRIWTRGKVPCWKSDWRDSRCASRT
jgi:hypothetical protein